VIGTPKIAGYSSGQALEALKEVAARTLPQGYGYEFSGLSYEELQAGFEDDLHFMLSIFFVFLFLAALYESWSVPFSVMLAVPIGAFGAILTLTFVPSLTDNVYAQIGLITLIGLAAKNAILIVEFAKERVDKGKNLLASTLEAVKLRLRPIRNDVSCVHLWCDAVGAGHGCRCLWRARTIGFTVCGRYAGSNFFGHIHCAGSVCVDNQNGIWKERPGRICRHNHAELLEREKQIQAAKRRSGPGV